MNRLFAYWRCIRCGVFDSKRVAEIYIRMLEESDVEAA